MALRKAVSAIYAIRDLNSGKGWDEIYVDFLSMLGEFESRAQRHSFTEVDLSSIVIQRAD